MTTTLAIIGMLSSALLGFFHIKAGICLNKEQESEFKETLRNVCLQSMRHGLPLDYIVQAAAVNCNNRLAQVEDKRREYRVHFQLDRNQPTKCEAFADEIVCTYHFDYSVSRISDAFDLQWTSIELIVAYPHSNGDGPPGRMLNAI